jgi:filamentous hemagglutinin
MAGTITNDALHGELPTPQELGISAGVGGATGGLFGVAAVAINRICNVAALIGAAEDAAAARRVVTWVDENAHMEGPAAEYQAGAVGARSNATTGASQAPELNGVRFDGFDEEAGVLIDRKVSVLTTEKSKGQAVRQSEALAAGGYRGRWEVPTSTQAGRAQKMFGQLGISNIDVVVVPR